VRGCTNSARPNFLIVDPTGLLKRRQPVGESNLAVYHQSDKQLLGCWPDTWDKRFVLHRHDVHRREPPATSDQDNTEAGVRSQTLALSQVSGPMAFYSLGEPATGRRHLSTRQRWIGIASVSPAKGRVIFWLFGSPHCPIARHEIFEPASREAVSRSPKSRKRIMIRSLWSRIRLVDLRSPANGNPSPPGHSRAQPGGHLPRNHQLHGADPFAFLDKWLKQTNEPLLA